MYDRICRNYFPQLPRPVIILGWFCSNSPSRGGGAVAVAYLSRRFYQERFLRLKDSLLQSPVESAALPDLSTPITTPSAVA